jgi:hypothetical protein
MLVRRLGFVLTVLAFSATAAFADQAPTISGPPTPTEAAFVTAMQTDLNARFPTADAATKAGYFRYTDADETGAISYANLQWQSSDVHHPSQLWFDKAGNLLGADYSVLKTGDDRPDLWGVLPGRWAQFDDHVHYVAKDPKSGAPTYDHWVMAPDFTAAGGDLKNPQADTLVKLKQVASTDAVTKIFDFPSIWDLIVWVKPNPKGAFAYKNPTVTP